MARGTVQLRPFRLEDVNARYLRWLNDPRTNAHLSRRAWTKTQAEAWVRDVLACHHSKLFIVTALGRPIGTLKLERYAAWAIALPTLFIHHHNVDIAVLGIMLGESRGRGYGSAAIRLGVQWAKRHWKVPRVVAGIKIGNVASVAAFRAAGFRIEPEEAVAAHD